MYANKHWAFITVFILLFIGACSIEEKPHYLINDAELRLYQGGDNLTYVILDAAPDTSRTGRYSITLESRDASPPNSNETVTLLFEKLVKTGDFANPFLAQFFSQKTEGKLVLEAFSNGEDVLWLLDTGETETGAILYPADLSTLTSQISFEKGLQRCDQDNICFDAGQINITLNPLGIETTETPYANFEAFNFEIFAELLISDPQQAGNAKNYTLSGNHWFYPLLGVVKFSYHVQNPTSLSSTLIGDLSSTNISIDESFKKINSDSNPDN